MIPNNTPREDQEQIIQRLLDSGLWTNKSFSLMFVVGVRGYYLNSMGRRSANDRGIYDDAIFVISPDTFTSFNGNTDPSRYKKGVAVLEAPQKITYRPGYHGYNSKWGHQAFRQASDVVVKRDGGVGNGKSLGGDRFTDKGHNRFWINLHRGGHGTTSSLGCQTLPPSQWAAFHSLVKLQLNRFGQKTFNYYLVENVE